MMKTQNRTHKNLLILGGTGDATELAAKAAQLPAVAVTLSLAGRTHQPVVGPHPTRIGGFGNVAGLIAYLQEQRIDGLIDATHPFAAQMSFHAAAAATAVGIPGLMLVRPAWQPVAGDRWLEVESDAAAAALLPDLAQRVFLTIGRQALATFAHLQDLWFLMRMVDPPAPDAPLPPGKLLLERGPFSLAEERLLLQHYQIGAMVSKNSGGDATYAKIRAARELGLPVVMIQRPPLPTIAQVADVESALAWLRNRVVEAGP